jgi:hypothetical protein
MCNIWNPRAVECVSTTFSFTTSLNFVVNMHSPDSVKGVLQKLPPARLGYSPCSFFLYTKQSNLINQ